MCVVFYSPCAFFLFLQLTITSLIIFPFNTAVDVSFSQTNATVVEASGNVSLILSVTGQLDTDLSVSVQVMSQDGTAIGESETEYGSI